MYTCNKMRIMGILFVKDIFSREAERSVHSTDVYRLNVYSREGENLCYVLRSICTPRSPLHELIFVKGLSSVAFQIIFKDTTYAKVPYMFLGFRR